MAKKSVMTQSELDCITQAGTAGLATVSVGPNKVTQAKAFAIRSGATKKVS
jgi:hypothetical protein